MDVHGTSGLHSFEFFADKIEQAPAFAETQLRLIPKRLAWLDTECSDNRPFNAGDNFSVADITGVAALMIADFFKIEIQAERTRVNAWADRVRNRPSVGG